MTAKRHHIYDKDPHFTIDLDTRALTTSMRKVSLIKGDHRSERFTFEMPAEIEGHKMSECDKVEVHFINIDQATRATSEGVWKVDDMQVHPEDSGKVVFSWLIEGTATKYQGSLSFAIRFTCLDGSTLLYAWNTAIYTGITVSDGIDNGETFAKEHLDLIEAWRADLEAARVARIMHLYFGPKADYEALPEEVKLNNLLAQFTDDPDEEELLTLVDRLKDGSFVVKKAGSAEKFDGKPKHQFRGNGTGFSYEYKGGLVDLDYNGILDGDPDALIEEGHYFIVNGTKTPTKHGFLDVDYFDGTGFDPDGSETITQIIKQTFRPYHDNFIYVRTGKRYGTTGDVAWGGWFDLHYYASKLNPARYKTCVLLRGTAPCVLCVNYISTANNPPDSLGAFKADIKASVDPGSYVVASGAYGAYTIWGLSVGETIKIHTTSGEVNIDNLGIAEIICKRQEL